jgi:site-specific DNA-cytosine methylase
LVVSLSLSKATDSGNAREAFSKRVSLSTNLSYTPFKVIRETLKELGYTAHARVPNVPEKYTLTNNLWTYLQNYAAKHKAAGNGFGFGLTPLDGIARTLSARYHKDGSEILIPQAPGQNPRRLTPRECARLQGFPDSFVIPVSDTPAYRQFGNSVVVPLMQAVGQEIVKCL